MDFIFAIAGDKFFELDLMNAARVPRACISPNNIPPTVVARFNGAGRSEYRVSRRLITAGAAVSSVDLVPDISEPGDSIEVGGGGTSGSGSFVGAGVGSFPVRTLIASSFVHSVLDYTNTKCRRTENK